MTYSPIINILNKYKLTRYGLFISGTIILSLLILFILVTLWIARGDWVYPEQPHHPIQLSLPLTQGTIMGQSFMARQAGLQSIGVRLHYLGEPTGIPITLKLYTHPNRIQPLRQAIANTENVTEGQYIHFSFSPLANSQYQTYYFTVETSTLPSSNEVTFYAAPLESYFYGAAYLDDVPQDLQVTFNLNYHRPTLLWGILNRIIISVPTILLTLIMLFVPGGTLLMIVSPDIELDPIEWLAIIIGLSLACYPLIILFLSYTPFSLSWQSIWITSIFLALFLIGNVWQKSKESDFFTSRISPISHAAIITFIVILGLSLAVRLYVITDIFVPFWGDSYQHTVLSQLIVDKGKLPDDWSPYAPLQDGVNYHFGFHAMVAMFHWFTQLSVISSVSIFSQLLNTLSVLMAYLTGRRFGKNAWVGVFAALITGLITQYPMFYINWGRFTQLAGQILLPVLFVLTCLLLSSRKFQWSLVGFTVFLLASLTITHYRVVIFYPCFVLPLLIIRWYSQQNIKQDILRLGITGLGTLLILLPRLIDLIGGELWKIASTISTQGMKNNYVQEVHAMLNLFDFLSPLIVILGLAGLMFGCWQHKEEILALGGWWIMLLLIANPYWLWLPGTGLITNFAVHIAAYLIFPVLEGLILAEIVQKLSHHDYVGWIVTLLISGIALLGANHQAQILDKNSMFVTPPDLQAMQWIKANVPSDAKFAVNNRVAYGGRVVAGTDAGWWIPLLTERDNTSPPMLYAGETPPYPQYNEDVLATFHELHEPNLSSENFAQRMENRGIDYLYIGQRRGEVGRGDEIPFDPNTFSQYPNFNLIYAEDGVRIFQRASFP